MPKELLTLGELLYWSYANLACAHAAVTEGKAKYSRIHFVIRSRLFKGLQTGSMNIRSIFDDEKLKYKASQACHYCGSTQKLSVDHLIPLQRGGSDTADNMVLACQHCNSSKGSKDLMQWMMQKEMFPPLMLLRRYLKWVINYCVDNDLLELSLSEAKKMTFPFDLELIPQKFPQPEFLELWIEPKN